MNLFIDTNIYLSFYHFSNDDLEQLKKLIVAIKDGKIKVFLPEQVIEEFKRNRENKIADALKKFNEQKLPNQFPQFCKDYPEYRDLVNLFKNYELTKEKLFEKLLRDIKGRNLKADKIINKIFDISNTIKASASLIQEAKERFDFGNPPGKNGSYGDAINWISLLKKVPEKEDLHIIARDKDYVSSIDDKTISEFLSDEWREINNSEAYLYTSLSAFFELHFPDIKLASEMEKKFAILSLINSVNFASTHYAIAKLSKFTDFTDEEINELVYAAVSNNQINLILLDEDVKAFYTNLIKNKTGVIHPDTLMQFKAVILAENKDEPDTSLPF